MTGRRTSTPACRLSVLACSIVLAASVLVPAAALAGAAPFPVSLAVSASSGPGGDSVTLLVHTVPRAMCDLRVRAGGRVRSLRATVGHSGRVRWRWSPVVTRPVAPWRFTATCSVGSLWSQRWTDVEVGFPTVGGALPEVLASPPGASCDAQRVCFAADPFPAGQCTWYAAGRRPDVVGVVRGNAGEWLEAARGRIGEGLAPAVGALAVWLPGAGGSGALGHVGYVAAVAGGRVLLDDSNWTPTPTSPGLEVHEHWVSADSPSGYIYGGPAGTGA